MVSWLYLREPWCGSMQCFLTSHLPRLYWLGLYEEECPGKVPRWMFEVDVVDSVKNVANQLREQYHPRLLLRRLIGYPARKPGDPEQRIELRGLALTGPVAAVESNASGVQLTLPSATITHRSGGGVWNNARNHPLVECDYCDRAFVSDDALHAHCIHKADHPYCDSCEILFSDEKALQQHTRDAAVHQVRERKTSKHHKDVAPFCSTCNMAFRDEHALQQHTRDASAHHFCKQCDRQFGDFDAVCRHLAASSRHDWCFACWKDLGSEEKLKKHCASQHTGKGKRTECPLCDEEFGNPTAIGPHIKRGCA
ncbi:hypothetical protein B0H19DRAFT_59145 [Mycena capillaripes]|nr:hypothetical protein B0H19DRAFT_59145 [Mycena capillaripes]